MTKEEFAAEWRGMVGVGWKGVMARAIDVAPGTVTRWVKGETELPGYMHAITEMALGLTQNGVGLPDAFLRDRDR
jgi:hypothetical protein